MIGKVLTYSPRSSTYLMSQMSVLYTTFCSQYGQLMNLFPLLWNSISAKKYAELKRSQNFWMSLKISGTIVAAMPPCTKDQQWGLLPLSKDSRKSAPHAFASIERHGNQRVMLMRIVTFSTPRSAQAAGRSVRRNSKQ
jgi:hypothetical protein